MRNAATDALLLVGAHQGVQLAEAEEQQKVNAAELAALQARVTARIRESGKSMTLIPDSPATFTPQVDRPATPEFSDLLAQARLAYPNVRHPAHLLSPAFHSEALERHQQLKAAVRRGRALNATEVTVAGFAGVLSALISAVYVDVPKQPGRLGGQPVEGGLWSNFVKEKMDASIPEKVQRGWESAYRVPYDAPHSGGLRNPVKGLSPGTHRFQSPGHDPLLGLIFGVRDLMRGEFTAIDAAGKVIVNQIGPGVGFWKALITFIMHLASDLTTPQGLPVPLMPMLQFIRVGSFGPQGYTVAQISRRMYRERYDLRHGVAMSLPVLMTELLIRVFYLFEQLRAGKTLEEALPFGAQPKLRRMLLIAHGFAAAGNAGKVALTKNPLTINAPQWAALARYAVPEVTWQVWGKGREIQGLIDQDFEAIHALYQQARRDDAQYRL